MPAGAPWVLLAPDSRAPRLNEQCADQGFIVSAIGRFRLCYEFLTRSRRVDGLHPKENWRIPCDFHLSSSILQANARSQKDRNQVKTSISHNLQSQSESK